MTKKDENGFINFNAEDLDPVVSGAIGQGRQRAADRRMTNAQRKKAEKDRQRNRRMIDLPKDLEGQLEALAAELEVPVSSLITWILNQALEVIDPDEIRLHREPTRSMRYGFILPYSAGKWSRRNR